jgi:hypothetical protein
MTDTALILVGKNRDGAEVFYTGRAGDGWVSTVRAEAFAYENRALAESTVERFNKMTPLHGVTFCVGPKVVIKRVKFWPKGYPSDPQLCMDMAVDADPLTEIMAGGHSSLSAIFSITTNEVKPQESFSPEYIRMMSRDS